MTEPDLVVRSARVVGPEGTRPAAIHVARGTIVRVAPHGDVPTGVRLVEGGDLAVFPGLVDTHVHANEPGRAEWEGFATLTRAAAAGGVTAVVDMPLNSIPPTTTVGALEEKRRAAAGTVRVDVGFWGGAVPANLGSLAELIRAGAFGCKAFLSPSGVEEFPSLDVHGLVATAAELSAVGAPLLVHAELPEPIERAAGSLGDADPRTFAAYLRSRPPEAEEAAVREAIAASERTGCRVHVVHLSAAVALEAVEEARHRGLPLSAETCPHYLALAAEEVPDRATAFKCAPPIREGANRERLWTGLVDGTLEAVVSDHSPCPPALKLPREGDFLRAWGGIASVELGLRVVWTEARRRGLALDDVVRWMSAGPARLAGLRSKGAIEPGRDADLVLFDPEARGVVDPAALHQRHGSTPYAGRTLDGAVRATYLRGVQIHREGAFPGRPAGRLLARGVS